MRTSRKESKGQRRSATNLVIGGLWWNDCRHGGTEEIKHAAQRARTIYRGWLAKDENKAKAAEQLKLFDLADAA